MPIRARRENLGLSVEQAARAAGCTVSMWYKVETGERRPSLSLANRIARVLEWDLDTFFMAFTSTESAGRAARTA